MSGGDSDSRGQYGYRLITGAEPAASRRTSPGAADEPARSTATVARHRATPPGDEAEEIIVGIAAAARYLGYDKPDSFRRARSRHPIPGEGRTDDGRPCWTPRALRSWQSKRKIAGNRINDGEL